MNMGKYAAYNLMCSTLLRLMLRNTGAFEAYGDLAPGLKRLGKVQLPAVRVGDLT